MATEPKISASEPFVKKHFAIAAFGSRGDFFPMMVAASQLKAAGHDVTVLCNPGYAKDCEECGLTVRNVGPENLLKEEAKKKSRTAQIKSFFNAVKTVNQSLIDFHDGIIEVDKQQHVDAVISGPLAIGAAMTAEKLGIPSIMAHPSGYDFWMCRDIPVFGPGMAWLNRVTTAAPEPILQAGFWVARKGLNLVTMPLVKRFRKKIGLKKVKDFYRDVWTKADAHAGMFPEWFQRKQPDWAKNFQNFDFPMSQQDAQEISDPTKKFLSEGDRPIVFTVSADPDAEKFAALAEKASRELGRRAIIVAPSLDRPSTDNVHYLKFVSYPKLLTHCAAFVHHGGVGTFARGIGAGIPQVIMPRIADQHNNAAIAQDTLGVSQTISQKTAKKIGFTNVLRHVLGSQEICGKSLYWQNVMRQYQPPISFSQWVGNQLPPPEAA